MLLSARMLINVADVNTWENSTQLKFSEGDTQTVYIQLIDANKDASLKPSGKRYVPPATATLSVTITNIDSTKTVVKTASKPYSGDISIWSFSILPADGIKGTCSLKLQLTDSGVSTYGVVKNALSVEPLTSAYC